MSPSFFRGSRSHGGQRIADAQGLQAFCNSIESFTSQTQQLENRLNELLELSNAAWKDDTAVAFLKSVREVIELLPPIRQNLQARKENVEMQIALMNEYNE